MIKIVNQTKEKEAPDSSFALFKVSLKSKLLVLLNVILKLEGLNAS